MNRRRFLALCAGAGAASIAGCSSGGAADYDRIDVGGVTRRYLTHFPADHGERPGEGYSLLVALHGGGGSAEKFSRRNGFVRTADREGFVVVHPDGKGLTDERVHVWNTGYLEPRLSDADDYAFVEQLVSHLVRTRGVDPRRVYLVGHSNGGMLAHEMAARAPGSFAAVAPVAAPVGGYPCSGPDACDAYTPPDPPRPVPVLTVQGTADEHVPYEGGRPERSLSRRPRYDYSAERTLDWWRRRNSCDGDPGASESGSGRIHHLTFRCRGSVGVEHFRFDGTGHFWGEFDDAVRAEGGYGDSLADLLWERLSRYVRPEADAGARP